MPAAPQRSNEIVSRIFSHYGCGTSLDLFPCAAGKRKRGARVRESERERERERKSVSRNTSLLRLLLRFARCATLLRKFQTNHVAWRIPDSPIRIPLFRRLYRRESVFAVASRRPGSSAARIKFIPRLGKIILPRQRN